MVTLQGILAIGKKSLAAFQLGINETSNNITNATTDGFSRRRVELKTSPPLRVSYYLPAIGTGVNATGITRLRDAFIDSRVWAENPYLGSLEKETTVMAEIEAFFNESSGTGLGSALTELFNSFQELANYPETSSARMDVQQNAVSLVTMFHQKYTHLTSIQQELNNDLIAGVSEVNELAQEIAVLNEEIIGIEASGVAANDARDRRDLLVDRLSKLMDVSAVEDDRGSINVYINGKVLVQAEKTFQLTTVSRSTGSGTVDDIVFAYDKSDAGITGGELGAIVDLRDTRIDQYLNTLDTLAMSLVQNFNTLHSTGYGLDGSTSVNFFDPATTGAADIALDAQILADTNKIAASSDGSPGDNAIALAIAQLADQKLLQGGTATFGEFYSSLVGTIGVQTQRASDRLTGHELIVAQLENQRESVSGVSLDEELINLLMFRESYEAAAKVFETTTEMIDTIISLV